MPIIFYICIVMALEFFPNSYLYAQQQQQQQIDSLNDLADDALDEGDSEELDDEPLKEEQVEEEPKKTTAKKEEVQKSETKKFLT